MRNLEKIGVLAAVLLSVFASGCGKDGPVPQPVSEPSDQMWSEEKSDARIPVMIFEGRALTTDYLYDLGISEPEFAEGGFYRITADVEYLNGGVAGYVDYPKVKRVSSVEEISPLDLGLPSVTEKRSELTVIGDYAEGDILLSGYDRYAVWQDGNWIFRYDSPRKLKDGTEVFAKQEAAEEAILAGKEEGILSCQEYFILPQLP